MASPREEVGPPARDSPLKTLFGNETAAKLMLYLLHPGEAYASGVSKDLELTLSSVQRQLEKFWSAGFFVSKRVGGTLVFSFNLKQPATRKLQEVIKVFYEGMSLRKRERMFRVRRRPRRRVASHLKRRWIGTVCSARTRYPAGSWGGWSPGCDRSLSSWTR